MYISNLAICSGKSLVDLRRIPTIEDEVETMFSCVARTAGNASFGIRLVPVDLQG